MIKKIISGGQIGADQAALDVAIKLGVPNGGWIQKGRKTQRGFLPGKYQLKEMPVAGFKERIEQNIIDSDGTVIISHGNLTGGSDYGQKMAKKHNRPCLHIDLEDKAKIANMKLNDLLDLPANEHAYFKNALDLLSGNKELLASCRSISKEHVYNEDDAILVIMEVLWKKLRQTHKLRLVK